MQIFWNTNIGSKSYLILSELQHRQSPEEHETLPGVEIVSKKIKGALAIKLSSLFYYAESTRLELATS